jgi:eukaryotic-like serine/threonine-protein kinase
VGRIDQEEAVLMATNGDQTEPYLPPAGGRTVLLPASFPPEVASEALGKTRVAMVGGSGPHLSSETDALRLVRLRAASTFLMASLAIFLIWRITFAQSHLWPLNAAVIAGIGAASVFLYEPTRPSARRLRWIEFAIFGQMVFYIAVRQYYTTLAAARDGHDLLLAARGGIIWSIMLMFVYAMFIPNTWHSAMRVIVAFALTPASVRLFVYLTHPAIFHTLRENATLEMLSENVVYTIVAASLAIYGTHIINSLRVEAFEAKQLNQYRLIAPIGSGGMGDVFLAEHRMMKRPCALKLIRSDRAGDPRAMARFEREVRATARLSHPNTIEIFDYGRTDDGTFYYVMEYLPGMSLQDLVDRDGPMSPSRTIYLLRQACGALAEAHATGLIHRDLKPANIIAAERGGKHDVVKILDFGLVRDLSEAAGDSGPLRTVQGTPLYMAPEQVEGRPDADHRLDLYALGCVAYTLLTGNAPFFDRGTRGAVMAAHVRDPVTPPSQLRPDLPADLERVVLRCLSKSPADRYPDADALDADLGACASSSDWDERRASHWWREHRPANRPVSA